MNHIFAVSGTEVLKTVLKILTIYYLVMEWNMCFSDHFAGSTCRNDLKSYGKGLKRLKTTTTWKKNVIWYFLVSINGHYWEQGLISLNKPYYKLHRFNPLVNKRNK